MSVKRLLPFFFAAVALVLVVGGWAAFWSPAKIELEREMIEARALIADGEARLPTIAGDAFRRDLEETRVIGENMSRVVEADLLDQRQRLRAYFPRVTRPTPSEPPHRDSFRDAYLFHQDELRRTVLKSIRDTTGRERETPPLIEPAFLAEKRLPKDETEMLTAQRTFNIETEILAAAAKRGAFPIRALDIREDAPAFEGAERFGTTRVAGAFLVAEQVIPAVLRALEALDGEGPIVKIEAISWEPRPLPKRLNVDEFPECELSVRLVIFELRKTIVPRAENRK